MKTIYVGMSGGVDSSVTAALLQRQGHRVVGVYMKNWTQDVAGIPCPWKQDLADARAAAASLDIPFKVFDFQAEYKQYVVDTMVAEYVAGRTPNPDILCNQEIKFKLFFQASLADGADAIATGHYARTEDGRLLTAKDTNKDQTYFLYRVTSDALSKAYFPVGGYTKPEIRRLAAGFNLPNANKPDSQGICFVGEVGIKEFLSQYVTSTPGPVVLRRTGETLGTHDGALFYTIGQRHGLGIGGGKPFYVLAKDVAANTVYVTDDPADFELTADTFDLEQLHWINDAPEAGKTYGIRARYRAALIDGTVTPQVGGRWHVQLACSERAISPGQSAVIYDGDRLAGGGLIAA